jgi:hypothetical protein
MDDIRSVIAALQQDAANVTDEQLAAALDAIHAAVAEHSANPSHTAEAVQMLTELRDAKNAVLAEQTSRADAAAALEESTAALLAELTPAPVDEAGTDGGEGGPGDAPADAPAGAPAADPAPVPVAASGRRAPIGALTPRRAPAPAVTAPRAKQTVTVSGPIVGYNTGQELATSGEVIKAFDVRRQAFMNGRGPDKVHVLRVQTSYPPERVLSSTDFTANYDKIEAATSPKALTAAGGACAPCQVDYSVEVIGSVARPVRDGLAKFGLDRGCLTFRPAIDGASAVSGVGTWSLQDDIDAGTPGAPDPTKTCVEVACPGAQNAEVQAVYQCLTFSNMSTTFDPEGTAANIKASAVAAARVAENRLLAGILAGSKLLTSARVLGAARDILVTLDKASAYLDNRHRDERPKVWMAPDWVLDLMRADIVRQLASGDWGPEALSMADQMITRWFTDRDITPIWHIDGLAGATVGAVTIPQQFYDNAAAGAAVTPFIDKIDSSLFYAGDWMFLDGGTLDIGMVRDSANNARNRYQTFSESFEGLAFKGVESLRLVMSVQPTGQSAGTKDTDALVD